MATAKLKRGTTLYRCAPDACLAPRVCSDTGKQGVYFSNYPLMPLAMCIELSKSMSLNVFTLTRDVELEIGKYAFRDINPDRYFGDGRLKPNVDPLPSENVSHFDNTIFSIIDDEYDRRVLASATGVPPNCGEVFLAGADLSALTLVRQYGVPLDGLLEVIQEADYATDAPEYWAHLQC